MTPELILLIVVLALGVLAGIAYRLGYWD